MRTKEEWLDFHEFGSMGQALRQIMDHVEFGEDNDGQIVIYTNLKFNFDYLQESLVDMDTGEKV